MPFNSTKLQDCELQFMLTLIHVFYVQKWFSLILKHALWPGSVWILQCLTERGIRTQFSMQHIHWQHPYAVTSTRFWKGNEKLICPGSKKCFGVGDLSLSILLVVLLSGSQPSSPTQQLRVSAGTHCWEGSWLYWGLLKGKKWS